MPAAGAGMGELSDRPAGEAGKSNELRVQDMDGASAGAPPTTPGSTGAKSPLIPQYSCINGKSDQRTRTDSRGTLIQRGEKKHKAAWADEVREGACVSEVREVKAFKNDGVGCGCGCSLM
mmetsp:Transcript_116043/g.333264  ORF Transcript_116043/g.333264 Transcript_116043/m.333264 type:complete len:120 (+) Transcript_116043:62-421(+)